ncbi:MAG: hypothetical protein QOF66_4227 [Mycobacterium sp.]|nr:hypothetical protein [Mycobacterium sp.]
MRPIRLTGRRPKARRTAHQGRPHRPMRRRPRPPSANPRQDRRGQRHLTASTVRTPGPHVYRPAGSAPTRVLSSQWHAAYWPISTPPTQSHTRTPTKHANITASAANTASATQTFDALTPPNNTAASTPATCHHTSIPITTPLNPKVPHTPTTTPNTSPVFSTAPMPSTTPLPKKRPAHWHSGGILGSGTPSAPAIRTRPPRPHAVSIAPETHTAPTR